MAPVLAGINGILLALLVGAIALGFAFTLIRRIRGMEAGTPQMQEISRATYVGAMAFMNRQYRTIAIFVVLVALALLAASFASDDIAVFTPIAFVTGAACSAAAGYIGMGTATRANVRTLNDRGLVIVDPEAGELAGGDEGIGRLAEPAAVVAATAATLAHDRDLAGVRVIVTAGPTQEPIDPVRYLTNRSSGKMGYAIAREAALRGADVTLVAGPTALPDPERVDVIHVRTVLEMQQALRERFDASDVVVQAAAPADFRPAAYHDRKIKKSEGAPVIELTPNPDVASELGARKSRQILVGFAAETDDHLANARKKRAQKNLDLIVLNNVGGLDHSPFGSDYNRVVFIGSDDAEVEMPLQLKSQIARALCDRVAVLLAERRRA